MANLVSKIRTNYAEITDLDKFQGIISHCIVDDDEEIHIIAHTDNGNNKYGFYCEATICGMRMPNENCVAKNCEDCSNYYECDEDCKYETFLKQLQQVIAPDDALIITTLCYEKMRYLQSYAEVITSKSISCLTLSSLAFAKAREKLGNNNWTTVNEY